MENRMHIDTRNILRENLTQITTRTCYFFIFFLEFLFKFKERIRGIISQKKYLKVLKKDIFSSKIRN